jgi:uncharacterized protein (TIGR02453 family)
MDIKSIFNFLTDLRENNNRDWFNENKPRFENAKEDFSEVMAFLISEVFKFDSEIGNLNPKECVFRIYKDVRFSKDKLPYKTNFGGFICKGGRKSGNAGYYIHLEPGNSFIGGGIHMPPPPLLKALRQHIFENYEEFLSVVDDKDFKKAFGKVSGEKLVRPPKGYDADFEGIEYLKHKSFTVIENIDDEMATSKTFLSHVIKRFKAMKDFNGFLNAVER